MDVRCPIIIKQGSLKFKRLRITALVGIVKTNTREKGMIVIVFLSNHTCCFGAELIISP